MNVTHFRHGKEAVLHNITLWTEQIVLLLQFNQLYRGYGRLLETSKNTTHVIKRSDSQPGLSNHRCPPPILLGQSHAKTSDQSLHLNLTCGPNLQCPNNPADKAGLIKY